MARLIVIQSILPRAASWSPHARRGGHVAFVLQWLIGLERLGHDVLFVNPAREAAPEEEARAVDAFVTTVVAWWRLDRSALIAAGSQRSLAGRSFGDVAAFAAKANALLTVALTGSPEPPPPLEHVRPRIFIDQDPGYTQLWAELRGREAIIGRHDVHFTVGANVATGRCALPTAGVAWTHTWNPVVLDWWPVGRPIARDRFTTIADWWGQPYVEFRGQILGPKREEFLKFISVPEQAGETVELALDIHEDDADLGQLRAHGWRIASPREVESVEDYRDWVSGSLGELSCVKGVYAGTRCGWFSERSTAYLASGRPVILQDTGFRDVLPTGAGLFAFGTPEEAVEAVRAVRADYVRHSKAARQIAEDHFGSAVVLARLLQQANVRSP